MGMGRVTDSTTTLRSTPGTRQSVETTEQHCRARGPSQAVGPSQSGTIIRLMLVGSRRAMGAQRSTLGGGALLPRASPKQPSAALAGLKGATVTGRVNRLALPRPRP
jgi:hypothetical protein